MTLAEYADVVVLPTVREHLAARDEWRRTYLACIATYSLVEDVARAGGGEPGAWKAVGDKTRAACAPAYEVVQGICNGTKHAGSNRGLFAFTPGDEIVVDLHRSYTTPAFFPGTVLVAARFGPDFPPMVVDHAAKPWGIDHCMQEVSHAFVTSCPQHLSTVDLSWLDVQFRPAELPAPTPPAPE